MNFKIGDRIFVRGYIDEIRKDTVIVRNDGGYFGTIPSEVTGELPSAQPEIIRCKECTYFDKYIDCKEMYQWDGFCADWARKTYENWYCSRAERRTDG